MGLSDRLRLMRYPDCKLAITYPTSCRICAIAILVSNKPLFVPSVAWEAPSMPRTCIRFC